MHRKKTAVLCIVALLMATISPAARASVNGQCDPYSLAAPVLFLVYVAIKAGIVRAAFHAPTIVLTGAVATGGAIVVHEVTDDDDEGTPPNDPPDMPDPIVEGNEGSEGDENRGESPEGGDAPEGVPEGGTETSGGGNTCSGSPYTW